MSFLNISLKYSLYLILWPGICFPSGSRINIPTHYGCTWFLYRIEYEMCWCLLYHQEVSSWKCCPNFGKTENDLEHHRNVSFLKVHFGEGNVLESRRIFGLIEAEGIT